MSEQARFPTPITAQAVEQRTSLAYSWLRYALAVVTVPYRRAFKLYTWQPLKKLRAANGDRNVLIPLVKTWKVDKYEELHSVQVAASFCGAAIIASLSWSRTANAHWSADALWSSALVCAIFAIITSIQSKSILDDLPMGEQLDESLAVSEVERMQRTILRYKKTPGIKHWAMLFIWQFPSMTMAYSWSTYLGGLTVYVCTPFVQELPWQARHKAVEQIAVTYLAVAFVCLVTYIFSTIFVYIGEKDHEKSANSSPASIQSTCANTIDLENGMEATNASLQASVQGSKEGSSNSREGNPIEMTRSKGSISLEQEKRLKQHGERSGRAGRQLLY
ncbi:uncharacterized protein K460DRAFT_318818 [Cucurbitaria berberidis CBS 394.84]|uniref:Uncharacterized protein n=1 Tax=Cucurbitaria berberidis CBS 394.84 TaxID=1168544 RepID=A0A9P4L554_9PLEO|nr:uncharacterized protein K460DRAFT_318818 [Cucurbitaria berberidis CBS 394.84]KAF1841628.1 hypothetical protein K460DRAFT_318818 [Cucurbitaria berberidis CBS 394.84]